ncbi:cobaltochelatase subunit CobN [Thermoanaerobacter kivui]|uniref:cobaltochelatase subunit CobN n=1 Tax=Thermoanaerobacter kivui TaxID=2325 RepID=UPI00130EBE0D|nr:cobaltochelatase subunit CobN [Thermoanaerobacter kivui]
MITCIFSCFGLQVASGAGGNSPTPDEYSSGCHLAQVKIAEIFRHNGSYPYSIAVKVGEKDAINRAGVSLSVAMYALGVKPVWDAAGNIIGIEVIDTADLGRHRIDAFIVIDKDVSKNFYSSLMLMDRAYRKILACSYNTLIEKYPELKDSLDSTLKPLGNYDKGNEPLEENPMALHWAEEVKTFLSKGYDSTSAGEMSINLRKVDSDEKALPKDAEVINASIQGSTNTMEIIFGNETGSGTGSGSGARTDNEAASKGVLTASSKNDEKSESKKLGNKEGYAIETKPQAPSNASQEANLQDKSISNQKDTGKESSSGGGGGGSGTGHVYEVTVENQQIPQKNPTYSTFVYLFIPLTLITGMIYQNKKGYLR